MTIRRLMIGFTFLLWGIIVMMSGAFRAFGPILIVVGIARILRRLNERSVYEEEEEIRDGFRPYHFKDEAEILAEKYEGKNAAWK